MNMNLTEIVAILDMSGSMTPLMNDTIGGFNALLEEQKKAAGDAYITTVLFDDRYIILHDRVNINKVEPITSQDYCPRGMTALLDAVGKTIVMVGERLAAMPEEERPGTVMVTIITDGEENASREYTWNAVQSMIKEQREKYSWLFTFIGANIDVMKVSQDLGIDKRMSRVYSANSCGTYSVYTAVSNSLSHARAKSSACTTDMAFTADDMMDELSKELDNIE